jgi:hypothetical protein
VSVCLPSGQHYSQTVLLRKGTPYVSRTEGKRSGNDAGFFHKLKVPETDFQGIRQQLLKYGNMSVFHTFLKQEGTTVTISGDDTANKR